MRNFLSAVALVFLVGCSDQLPPVEAPSLDVTQAALGTIAAFDADGSGSLTEEEACAGMTLFWQRYDQDEDGTATQEEIETRYRRWTQGDTGMMNMRVEVIYRGQPLTNAQVNLTPFDFLDGLLPAEGVTDAYGFAFVAIPKDQLPESQQSTFGMQVGLYKVSITHPTKNIPAEYNENTELSVDLSPGEADTGIRFKLK